MTYRRIVRSSLAAALALALAACGADRAAAEVAGGPADADAAGWTGMAAADLPATGNGDGDLPSDAMAAGPAGTGGGLRDVEIPDTRSGETALTVSLPEGWQVQGGVAWDDNTQCMSNRMRTQYRAQSADGSEAYEVMPGYTWQVPGGTVQLNPCPVLPVTTARQWLTSIVEQRRPGARILEYRDRPDFAAQLAAAGRDGPAPPAGFTYDYDAGQVLIAFEQGGREMREMLTTTITISRYQGSVNASAGLVNAMRAPAGRLDFAKAEAIAASARINHTWFAAATGTLQRAESGRASAESGRIASWHAGEMARINAKGAADRASIRAQTQQDLYAIGQRTHANTVATNDGIFRQNMEGLGEYSTYRGIDGGEVRSSIHGGERVLQMQNGSAFSTDDPYYNPAGSTELEQVR